MLHTVDVGYFLYPTRMQVVYFALDDVSHYDAFYFFCHRLKGLAFVPSPNPSRARRRLALPPIERGVTIQDQKF